MPTHRRAREEECAPLHQAAHSSDGGSDAASHDASADGERPAAGRRGGPARADAPQIADEANVSIDAFFECFESKDECFLAALDMLADELLRVTAGDGLDCGDWPRAVRRSIAS